VQEIISGPLERTAIKHAEDNLKEVIFKQGALKNNLTEAKESFKNMIATFVDRLGYMASSSITYQEKIENFSTKLAKTDDVKQINSLLENLMKDTYSMQTDIAQSSSELMAQREQFEETQQQISKLQEELSQLSEKISEDPLTGLLNRRGLDEAMVREVSRAHREGLDLCVALIDIDNFKVFNDKYGHSVGDAALLHLAKVMQETLRATDVPARFGGEEFVVLLPNTSLDYAVRTIERLQQVLTERFFSGNNQRLLITFSAGVALFNVDEAQDDVIMRADQAMYLAKETGKNQVKSEIDLLASQKSAVAHTI
jgi:diguanylate cyclase